MNLKIQRLTAITLAAVLVGGSDYAQAKTVTDRRLAVQATTHAGGRCPRAHPSGLTPRRIGHGQDPDRRAGS